MDGFKGINMTDEEKQERLISLKQKLITALEKEYGDIPLVTLHELTEEIKVVPNVRSGKKERRDTTNYYELSPTKLNKYDELLIQKRELGPANSQTVKKYSLRDGDLLVSYRGYRKIPVGRFVKKECDKPAVAAVSNILIRFEEKENDSLSLLVHKYLTDEPAQHYLSSGALNPDDEKKEHTHKRFLINKVFLAELPIPDFRALIQWNSIERLYYTQKDLLATVMQLDSNITKIRANILQGDASLLQVYLKNNSAVPELLYKNSELLEQLKLLKQQSEKLLKESVQ